jgi:sugar/nucleoside kinase (ribokinase family)
MLMQIVVVGSVALDSVETRWGKAENALGGSATFFSLAAARDAKVGLVAVVGEDLPRSARDLLSSKGIDIRGLQVEKGECFRWGGRYHEDMNRRDTLFTHLNVFEHFHPVLPDSYLDAELLFLANIHPSLQLEVLEQAKNPRLVAVDTMNLWIESSREDLVAVLKRCDLVFLNDEEVCLLSGKYSLVDAVRTVQAMGPQRVVVKKGEHGAILFDGSQRFALPAVVLERVKDPTGAGDTFAGGFLGHLAGREKLDHDLLREAMIEGTVLASFAAEDFSVRGLEDLSPATVDQRRKELHQLVAWPK